MVQCLNITDIAIITVTGLDYCYIILDIIESETILLLENSVLDDCEYIFLRCKYWKSSLQQYFDNLVKAKKLKTKTISIAEKTISIWWFILWYILLYVHSSSIKTLGCHYPKKWERLKNTKGKNSWWMMIMC